MSLLDPFLFQAREAASAAAARAPATCALRQAAEAAQAREAASAAAAPAPAKASPKAEAKALGKSRAKVGQFWGAKALRALRPAPAPATNRLAPGPARSEPASEASALATAPTPTTSAPASSSSPGDILDMVLEETWHHPINRSACIIMFYHVGTRL